MCPSVTAKHQTTKLVLLFLTLIVLAGGVFFGHALLARRRTEHLRVSCTANLHQIGLGLKLYALSHGNVFPPDFESAKEFINQPKLLLCPAHGELPGDGPVDEWSDYVLVPGRTPNDNPDTVLVYGRLANHAGEGAGVLFVNGRSQWLEAGAFRATISAVDTPDH